jgi:acetyl-CoA synthetase
MVRNIWGDPKRFQEQYWSRVPGSYFTGDAARRDDDGYYWVLGRVDDVMNVSGHRLSTMEIESALVHHPAVAEAAVVGKPHEITGQAVCCFVTLKKGDWNHEMLGQELRQWVLLRGPKRFALRMRCRRRAAGKSCGGCCAKSLRATLSRAT